MMWILIDTLSSLSLLCLMSTLSLPFDRRSIEDETVVRRSYDGERATKKRFYPRKDSLGVFFGFYVWILNACMVDRF